MSHGEGTQAPQPGNWLAAARRATEAFLRDERLSAAVDTTKQAVSAGGRSIATGLDRAKGQFTQEEAWREVEGTIADLVDVIRVQHAKIEDLTRRLELLESRES